MIRVGLRRYFLETLLAFSTALLASCGGPFHLSDTRTTSTPRAQSLDVAELAHKPVATLPTVAPSALQGYGLSLSLALTAALSEVSPPIQEIPAYETLNRLSAKGLAADYVEITSDYVRSGVLDRQRLERIGSALGSRYVLQPGLTDYKETLVDRFELFGWKMVRARVTTLRLWVQLWDTQTGQILWESTGEATVAAELLASESSVPLDEIAKKLWSRMVQDDLLSGKTKSRFFLRD